MNRKTIQIALALLVVSLLITAPHTQQQTAATQSSEDRIALYQALLDLTNPWTVMCIAAHPDDEDGTSLIVMRRKYGAHTVSLFSTFGEGGQNAIGPDLYEELGAIRARETMAAAEIQGSEPHFLGLKDFGYSKSADEAFRFWGHEEALRRMVLEIRKLRPDVIITNHSATSNDHGHHQATARLELEAFDAAADPTRFPELLKDGVTTWQVQRLFVRSRGNQAQTSNTGFVTIDPNEQDPVRGTVYAEEALRALQKHATQGPWPKTFAEFASRFRAFSGQSAAPGQLPPTRYALVREAKGAGALPQDSHNFLDGLRLREDVAREIALPTLNGSLVELAGNRLQALDQLLKGFSKGTYGTPIDRPADANRRALMKDRVEHALAAAAGVNLRVKPSASVVVPGSTVDVSIQVDNSGTQAVTVSNCTSDLRDANEASSSVRTPAGSANNRSNKIRIPDQAPINVPLPSHLYEASWLGLSINTRCALEVSGAKFSVGAWTHVDVGPAVEIIDVKPSPFVITPKTANNPPAFAIQLVNHRNEQSVGKLNVPVYLWTALAGFTSDFSLMGNESREVTVPIPPALTPLLKSPSSSKIEDGFRFSTSLSGEQSKPFVQRAVPLAYVDARVAPKLSVGYIRGFDYSLPNALNALGVESKELSVDEVKTADLQKYTTIIVDNRVYESQPELIAANQKLLDYANAGGNLIVFYHKSDEWNPDERRKRPQLAPYKLILGNERITDENALISFLEPDHPLLNVPNKLNQDDFKDWIQERGLYYPKEWDPQFHALLQSNDPGEAQLKGGLLVADYGRGHYIYTSMVWYRELRAGVPGAYRMLANMISYGRQ